MVLANQPSPERSQHACGRKVWNVGLYRSRVDSRVLWDVSCIRFTTSHKNLVSSQFIQRAYKYYTLLLTST